MAKNPLANNLHRYEPQQRLKQLIKYSDSVVVDSNVPPKRYYRSGLEMLRMANVYHNEGNLENAYCLYLKFMTLFLEKIRQHPDFNTVPASDKALYQAKLREVLPKAEKLKAELLDKYTKEYETYAVQIKKLEDEQRKKKTSVVPNIPKSSPKKDPEFVTAKLPNSIDNVNYPDPNLSSNSFLPSAPPQTPVSDTSNDGATKVAMLPSLPSVDRSNKPSDIFVDNLDKDRLRNVIVPTKLMVLFENMVQSNTTRNVETCAILAGKLERNELIVTHMIVPKQKGTSDSCATMNEEEIFDYQDQHNLITIGWIHTHPTQTAFLSSVDLHTHCPYQLLMPEAIAIVCSPKYRETGFFNLTPKYGLQYIANCRQTGFHPHPSEPPLFKVAEHVRTSSSANLEVLDLR